MAKIAGLLRPIVEHVFLVDQSGLPLVHLSRIPSGSAAGLLGAESEVLSKFLDPALPSEAPHTRQLADLHVAFGSGKYMRLFVLYRGRTSIRIGRRVERAVRELERRYGAAMMGWHGKIDEMADVNRDLGRLWGLRDLNVASASPAAKGAGTVGSPGFISAIIRPPLDPKLR